MHPSFAPEELAAIQRFQEEEGLWIDTVVRARSPRVLVWLAERGDGSGFVSRCAAFLASYYSRLEKGHKRHIQTNMRTKGFRKGYASEKLDGITTTLYRHGRRCKEVRAADGVLSRPMCSPECVVASHRFDVGVSL